MNVAVLVHHAPHGPARMMQEITARPGEEPAGTFRRACLWATRIQQVAARPLWITFADPATGVRPW